MEPISIDESYIRDLQTIKETITENRYKALVVVNSAMIMTYHTIGTIINKRKEWGNKYIQRLAEDLKEYGRGYSYRQLKRMSQFARLFTDDEIGSQVGAQIPWRTITEIMSMSSSKEEMLWYMNQTYKNRWSRRMVVEQFKIKAYKKLNKYLFTKIYVLYIICFPAIDDVGFMIVGMIPSLARRDFSFNH